MHYLPTLSTELQAHSAKLEAHIQQKITEAGGWIDFVQFMQMALYTPLLGYYSGGVQKFGKLGDFVTAPLISPLFAQTIANQAKQILSVTQGSILELGAGTGKLAADLLLKLAELNQLPSQYFVLEVSDYLRHLQHENLQNSLPQDLFSRIVWIQSLPEEFVGLILTNEVLDALPVHLVHQNNDALLERGVVYNNGFCWKDRQIKNLALLEHVKEYALPNDYITEFCPLANALMKSLANSLARGAIIMIDYGFGASEYYHPDRNLGTLMCHFQHYAHDNPFINIGLQDITAHVNFSEIAACEENNIMLAGYVNQAQFLINCGILDLLEKVSSKDLSAYTPLASAAHKLLSPAEMGELFKVIAFTKNIEIPLIGFTVGDKSHTL